MTSETHEPVGRCVLAGKVYEWLRDRSSHVLTLRRFSDPDVQKILADAGLQ